MKRILFVCTGNTCRSPMAEAVFNAFSYDKKLSGVAFSRGLDAYGDSISGNALRALTEIGIHADKHISKTVCKEDIDNADFIVGITSRHAGKLLSDFPDSAHKIYAFPTDISDPFGGDIEVYKKCLSEISDGVKLIISELFPEEEADK